MRLAILIGHFPPGPFGGAEVQAEEWAARLSARHAVTVISRRDPPTQPAHEDRDGYRVVRTPLSRVPGWRTVADLHAIDRAFSALDPLPEMLLCFQTFVSGLAGVRLQRHRGIPAVVWVRGESEYRLRGGPRARLSPRIWSQARGVLVQSEWNRTALLAELERHAPAHAAAVATKLRVVPNGIAPPAEPTRRGGSVLVLGRLIPQKGVDLVVEALAGLDGARVIVAGEGGERFRLERLARARGVCAEFRGFVARADLPRLWAEACVLVLAARADEGFPNVLLEAMAHGVPVVATPVAGVRDLVQDGRTGLLVPVGDVAALRSAVTRVMTNDGLAQGLARGGRERAADYAWERVVPRLEAALEAWRPR